MTDTSIEIKKIQLAIWMKKSPAERLRQFLQDNEQLFLQCKKVKNCNLQDL